MIRLLNHLYQNAKFMVFSFLVFLIHKDSIYCHIKSILVDIVHHQCYYPLHLIINFIVYIMVVIFNNKDYTKMICWIYFCQKYQTSLLLHLSNMDELLMSQKMDFIYCMNDSQMDLKRNY